MDEASGLLTRASGITRPLASDETLLEELVDRESGLVGAMASAVIVGALEAQLEEVVLLALLVPAVVHMAIATPIAT